MITSLDKTIMRVFEKLGNQMSTHERQVELDAKGSDFFMELLHLENLSWNEQNTAHIKILACDKLLNAFAKIPPMFKTSWIRSLLQQ